MLTAAEAERFGLVTRVVPAADVLPTAMSTAVRLAKLAPQAVQGTKAAVNRLLAMASGAVLPLSLALEAAAMEHDDFRAAMEKLGRK
ncbi:3-hydroxybutyryl-CoA dehydratase [Mycobacterium tuberculosis]|nr:3-hydroxybutyryl-CoA dehydratase [Mycobacterium tuberculosis]